MDPKRCENCEFSYSYFSNYACKIANLIVKGDDHCQFHKEAIYECDSCGKDTPKLITCEYCWCEFCKDCIKGYEKVPDVMDNPMAFCEHCFPFRHEWIATLRDVSDIVCNIRLNYLTDNNYLLKNWS